MIFILLFRYRRVMLHLTFVHTASSLTVWYLTRRDLWKLIESCCLEAFGVGTFGFVVKLLFLECLSFSRRSDHSFWKTAWNAKIPTMDTYTAVGAARPNQTLQCFPVSKGRSWNACSTLTIFMCTSTYSWILQVLLHLNWIHFDLWLLLLFYIEEPGFDNLTSRLCTLWDRIYPLVNGSSLVHSKLLTV